MTTEEMKGRRITAAIAAWCLVPALIAIVAFMTGNRVTAGTWVMNVGLQILFAWLLYQGYRWIRILTIAGCALAVISAARLIVLDASVAERLVVLLVGGVQGAVGFVLWRSSSVRAYFARQDSTSSLNLSGV